MPDREDVKLEVGIVSHGPFQSVLFDPAIPKTVYRVGNDFIEFKTTPERIPITQINAAVSRLLTAERKRLEAEIERLQGCGPDNCPNHPKNKDAWVRESWAKNLEQDAIQRGLISAKTYAKSERKRVLEMAVKIADYAVHDGSCILGFCQQGRPTPDGGYEQMLKGEWYQVKPEDKRPKCECGLDALLSRLEGEGKP